VLKVLISKVGDAAGSAGAGSTGAAGAGAAGAAGGAAGAGAPSTGTAGATGSADVSTGGVSLIPKMSSNLPMVCWLLVYAKIDIIYLMFLFPRSHANQCIP